MKHKELIERLELAYGCFIGSHIDNTQPTKQLENIIKELKQVKNITVTPCCKSDSEQLCDCKNTEPEIDGWVRCKDCGEVFMV